MQKEDYFNLKNYINPSSFKGDDIKTPLHWKYNWDNPQDDENKALKIGSAFHCLVLEPHKFNDLYFLCKKDSFTGKINKDGSPSMSDKENKVALSIISAENPDKTILFSSEIEQLFGMRDGIKRDLTPQFDYLMARNNSKFEMAFFAQAVFDKDFKFMNFVNDNDIEKEKLFYTKDGLWYLRIKTKSDHHHLKKNYASDLKTTVSADKDEFASSIYSYGYWIQAAFTLDMLTHHYKREYLYFLFPVVEKEPPYAAAIFECDQTMINKGKEVYKRRLEYIIESLAMESFKGYEIYSDNITFDENGVLIDNRKIISIDLPQWCYAKLESKQRNPLKPF